MSLGDQITDALRMRKQSLQMDMAALDKFKLLLSQEDGESKYKEVVCMLELDIPLHHEKIALLEKDLSDFHGEVKSHGDDAGGEQ